jgi:hypothetical protein
MLADDAGLRMVPSDGGEVTPALFESFKKEIAVLASTLRFLSCVGWRISGIFDDQCVDGRNSRRVGRRERSSLGRSQR